MHMCNQAAQDPGACRVWEALAGALRMKPSRKRVALHCSATGAHGCLAQQSTAAPTAPCTRRSAAGAESSPSRGALAASRCAEPAQRAPNADSWAPDAALAAPSRAHAGAHRVRAAIAPAGRAARVQGAGSVRRGKRAGLADERSAACELTAAQHAGAQQRAPKSVLLNAAPHSHASLPPLCRLGCQRRWKGATVCEGPAQHRTHACTA